MHYPPRTESEWRATFRHAVNRLIADGADCASAIRLVAHRYTTTQMAVITALQGDDA